MLVELGHLQVYKGQLVIEYVVVVCILQLDFMAIALSGVLVVRKFEVQDTNGKDTLQAIVPFAFGSLLANGCCGIVDASVLEVCLLCLLHLNDEPAAVLCQTVYVEYGAAVAIAFAEVLAVQILHVLNLLCTVIEKGIKETDKQVLVHLGTKQFLEAEICIRIDVSLSCVVSHKIIFFK